jgi:hypothetical protein
MGMLVKSSPPAQAHREYAPSKDEARYYAKLLARPWQLDSDRLRPVRA